MKILFILAFFLFPIRGVYSDTISGTVIRVVDGDTIIVKNQIDEYWIRLAGIDAPDKAQPMFDSARRYLELLLNMSNGESLEEVRVEYDLHDKHGRRLGTVFLNGKSINERMVSDGYAWYLIEDISNEKFARSEAEARANKRGLWALMKAPVSPWDYRKSKTANN